MKCILLVLALLLPGWAVGATIEKAPFRMHYAEQDADTAAWSLRVLQEAAREFESGLPAGTQPIDVHIAHTEDEFRQLTPDYNVHVSGVARSWRGMIIVKGPQLRMPGEDYRGTLRHELVHVLLYRNANTDRIPQWLNEGLAMMLANEFHWEASLRVARMFLSARVIEYKDLGMAFQAPRDSTQFSEAYAQSLSMTQCLRDTVGEATLWRIVKATREMSFGDAMRQYAHLSPLDFWGVYRQSLWGVALMGSLVSGSFFTPTALLFLFVYAKRRREFKRGMARLAAQEARQAEDEADMPAIVSWDDVAEDPEAWKGEDRDDEEERESWR